MIPPIRIVFGWCLDNSRTAFCQNRGAIIGSIPSMINNKANAVIKSCSTRATLSYYSTVVSEPKYSKKLDVGLSTMTSLLAPKELP